jgi:hypothetical protein
MTLFTVLVDSKDFLGRRTLCYGVASHGVGTLSAYFLGTKPLFSKLIFSATPQVGAMAHYATPSGFWIKNKFTFYKISSLRDLSPKD